MALLLPHMRQQLESGAVVEGSCAALAVLVEEDVDVVVTQLLRQGAVETVAAGLKRHPMHQGAQARGLTLLSLLSREEHINQV